MWGNETWWVELATHQASLPLALAILIQDYRFGFADLFLNAIALLGLMGVSIALLSGAIAPLLQVADRQCDLGSQSSGRGVHRPLDWTPR